MKSTELKGRTIDLEYAKETYRIEFLDGDSLRWTRTVGEDVGATDEETYVATQVDESRLYVSWVEASGLGLSNLIDLSSGRLVTHANEGRQVFVNTGVARLR